MGIRIDPNGKVFTDRVRRETVACIIQTVTHRMRGHIFRLPESRVIDDFNQRTESFIDVTHAEVLDAADQVVARSDFLMLNKAHVVWVLPADRTAADASDADA